MQDPNTEEYSPYCKICESCGEEGCCSPLSCKQDPEGDYCQTYLRDLKFGYSMQKFFETNILSKIPQELQDQYWEAWDKVYDKYHTNQTKES